MQTDKMTTGGSAPGASARPGLADEARRTARHEMDDARQRLHGAGAKARREASQAGASVSRLVLDEMDRRKDDLCESLHGLAEAMRTAADEAERRDDAPTPPRFLHQAINTIDDMADRMRHRSAEDLTGAVSRFGRENPALFVAGAVFAGLALGRFLVSSGKGGRHDHDFDRFEDRFARGRDFDSDPFDRPSSGYSSGRGMGSEVPSGTGVGGTSAAHGSPTGTAGAGMGSAGAGSSGSGSGMGSSGMGSSGMGSSGAGSSGAGSSGMGSSGTGSSGTGSSGMGSGTGSGAGMGAGSTPGVGSMNEGSARDSRLGQGGVPQPGGPQTGDASNSSGTGTADWDSKRAATSGEKKGDKDGSP